MGSSCPGPLQYGLRSVGAHQPTTGFVAVPSDLLHFQSVVFSVREAVRLRDLHNTPYVECEMMFFTGAISPAYTAGKAVAGRLIPGLIMILFEKKTQLASL